MFGLPRLAAHNLRLHTDGVLAAPLRVELLAAFLQLVLDALAAPFAFPHANLGLRQPVAAVLVLDALD
jgi:hypothetical protein